MPSMTRQDQAVIHQILTLEQLQQSLELLANGGLESWFGQSSLVDRTFPAKTPEGADPGRMV